MSKSEPFASNLLRMTGVLYLCTNMVQSADMSFSEGNRLGECLFLLKPPGYAARSVPLSLFASVHALFVSLILLGFSIKAVSIKLMESLKLRLETMFYLRSLMVLLIRVLYSICTPICNTRYHAISRSIIKHCAHSVLALQPFSSSPPQISIAQEAQSVQRPVQ